VNGVVTRYLVEDDVNPTGYPQVFEELTGGAVTRTYTYGLQRIDEEQVLSGAWTPSFYGYDGGGNVRTLTNSAGAITDTYEYDAFGNSFTVSGTTPNNYLYRGEQYDPDLGLYYLRARYYNPLTGRFMSRDPFEGVHSVPATMHKYIYAGADPSNWTDPSGRDIIADVLITAKRTLTTVQALNTIGCFISIGNTVFTAFIAEKIGGWTAVGAAGTYYSCLTIMLEPESALGQWSLWGANMLACGTGLAATINDVNEWSENQTAANEATLVADYTNGVLGCAITALGQDLGPE
jgi:RHS repeat-associated protein